MTIKRRVLRREQMVGDGIAEPVAGHAFLLPRVRGAMVGYARLSSSTGIVRTPAVWRSYSAKPG